MKLDGGIEEYCVLCDMQNQPQWRRYKADESPYGRKVKYLQENGFDSDVEYANKYMTKGQILTVREIHVGRWSSTVEFVEVPDKKFNTVMFEDVEKI